MKNNKGFTLVEVIAVIAIISILTGVTITAVTRYMQTSKKKTYKNYESNLKKAAANYMTSHPELIAGDVNLTLKVDTLIEEGFLEEMTDPIDKNKDCSESYVMVDGKREANQYNIDFSNNKICLICPSYSSPGCGSSNPPIDTPSTCQPVPVNIEYDHSSLTNQNVVAKVTSSSSTLTITNNGGSNSYTFTKNGQFTFNYTGENNCAGTAIAKVNWIDKTTPSASIEYSESKKTTKPVSAKLVKETEPITILNNNGKSNYIFKENGTFEFIYQDKAGNVGKTVAKVDWIENSSEPPIDIPSTCQPVPVNIEYDHSSLTNQNVVAKVTSSSSTLTITNNGGSNSYTFTKNGQFTFNYTGENNCAGTAIAKVNWIDKTTPSASIEYSESKKTTKPVSAKLVKETETITILNNNGKNSYTFKENGTFEFIYQDKAGNVGKTVAKVDWIKNSSGEEKPTTPDSNDKNDQGSGNGSSNNHFDSNVTDSNSPSHSKDQDTMTNKEQKKKEEERQRKRKKYSYLIIEIILFIILILIIFYIRKKRKKQDNYMD